MSTIPPRSSALIDSISAGVLDGLRQLRREGTSPVDAQLFTASVQSNRTDVTGSYGFRNDRSAAWWHLRELLDPSRGSTVMLPDDDKLPAELSTARWTIASGSVIAIESKDELRERLGRSTDRADSIISAYFTSGVQPGAPGQPSAAQLDPFHQLRIDPGEALDAWNRDIDTSASTWADSDPHVTDASYYGYIDWGT